MTIPNKIKLQQIAFNHSSDINFQDFMNVYKRSTVEPYSLLVMDTTLSSDNSLHFRNNLLETIQKLIITINNEIRDKKLQYDINREAAKTSASSFRRSDKYDYLIGEEILLSDQGRLIKQAQFTYYPLGKVFEIKIEDQGEK